MVLASLFEDELAKGEEGGGGGRGAAREGRREVEAMFFGLKEELIRYKRDERRERYRLELDPRRRRTSGVSRRWRERKGRRGGEGGASSQSRSRRRPKLVQRKRSPLL